MPEKSGEKSGRETKLWKTFKLLKIGKKKIQFTHQPNCSPSSQKKTENEKYYGFKGKVKRDSSAP